MDLVIRGAQLIDGTGAPARAADVGIGDDAHSGVLMRGGAT
jgi:N-acyl-D-aspartate/D-glutamate deacylase